MQYFFHIITDTQEIRDPEGSALASEELAQDEAVALVQELRTEFPGRFGHGSVREVVNDQGRRVMALPIPA